MMTILLTGATGFVGRNLIDNLLDRPEVSRLIALVRSPEKAALLPTHNPRLEILEGNLLDPDSLNSIPPDITHVIHTAALVGLRNGQEFYEANVSTTQNLLDALIKQCPSLQRVLMFSSIAAIDRPPNSRRPYPLMTENDPPSPQTDYGKSKLEAERLLMGSGLPYTILIPAFIYGPYARQGSTMDRAVRDTMAANPYTRFPFTGHASMIYAGDLADITYHALNTAACRNQRYLVANPEPVAVGLFFETLRRQLGKTETTMPIPRWLMGLVKHQMHAYGLASILGEILFEDYFAVSCKKLYRDISYRPYYGFGPGLKLTLESYQTQAVPLKSEKTFIKADS